MDPKKANMFFGEVEFCVKILREERRSPAPGKLLSITGPGKLLSTEFGVAVDGNCTSVYLGSDQLLLQFCTQLCGTGRSINGEASG